MILSLGELPNNRPNPLPIPFSTPLSGSQPGSSPLLPALCTLPEAELDREEGLLTDHRCSPSQSGLGPLREVVHGRGSTVRHLEVGVDVDATGDDHLPVGLDGFHPAGNDEVVSDLPVSGT